MGQFKESTMKSFAFVCLFAAAYAAAEADPALLYSSLGYGGYTGYGYHHPYTYGAYAPFVAAVPAVHSAAVKSVVETPAEVKTTVHAAPVVTYNAVHHATPVVQYNTVAAPVVQTAGYYANSGGAVHIVKREADAEADADAVYYYSGYRSPYAYGAYRSPFYGVRPYTYGFNHGYYGGYYY